MRRAIIPLACLLVLAAWAQPAVAATKQERQRICAKRGFTVDSSKLARVFEVDRQGEHSMYGCMRSSGRLQLLASWFSCECSVGDEPSPFAELYGGRVVAIDQSPACGPLPGPCGSTSHTLRDLKTRREVYPAGPVSQVIRGAGYLAYEDGRVVLVQADERVLDPGPGIEFGSMAVAGKRIYWTRDGQPQSALL